MIKRPKENTMPTKRIAICLVALTAISSTAVQVLAQQGGNQGRPLPAGETINVDFSGGTLEDLLATIKGDNAVSINVVASMAAREAEIPELDLRHVRVPDMMDALDGLGHLVIGQAGDNLYFIRQRDVGQEQRQVRIYDIRALATKEHDLAISFAVEDIVTALTTAWEMDRDEGPRPDLKFHQETHLLVVYGNSAQQEIAKSVLEKLQNSQKDRTWEAERVRKIGAADQLQREKEFLTTTVTELKQSNRVLMEENKRKTVDALKLRAEMQALQAIRRDLEYNNRQLTKEIETMKKKQSN